MNVGCSASPATWKWRHIPRRLRCGRNGGTDEAGGSAARERETAALAPYLAD